MGKRSAPSGSAAKLIAQEESKDVSDALSLSSDSELALEDDGSDLPDETDSEAGLPSDDFESDEEEGGEEDASEEDELDQAFLSVLQDPIGEIRPQEGYAPSELELHSYTSPQDLAEKLQLPLGDTFINVNYSSC